MESVFGLVAITIDVAFVAVVTDAALVQLATTSYNACLGAVLAQ